MNPSKPKESTGPGKAGSGQQQAQSGEGQQYGEGSYQGTKQYN